ncbi:MAG: bifunctional oligoribonuclease/PAP phosphatase NrnA [Nitrospinota bacterium]|nr:bifunctional oligoribonuclease/PAP phosphatase NrnA [Nitrospinota bacterium]
MSFAEAVSFIGSHGRFLITSHVNPDGDAIGAAMGVKWALDQLGKESQIIFDSKPPEIFSFLENYQAIGAMEAAAGVAPFDAAIFVDSPTLERVGLAAGKLAAGARILNVDHHVSNEYFGYANLVEPTMSSSAEMVYQLIIQLGLKPDRICAEYLYTGLIIDTGRFRFSNTSPSTFRMAAELVTAGARPEKISEAIYERNTLATTQALGRFIESLEVHFGGRAAIGSFGYDYISSEEYKEVETEGFVNHALSIHGVDVAAFLKEIGKGKTRASLRSRGKVDVNLLASVFGGGGHERAAGCTIMAPLAEAKARLLSEIELRINS